MMTILRAILIALLQPIFTWYAQRQAKKATAEEQAMRTRAQHDAESIRDRGTAQTEQANVENQAAADQLRRDADAGSRDVLRHESGDVDAAISAANGDVR